jgi:hypothetical protein
MQVYMNRAFVAIKKALAAINDTTYVGDVSEDNQQATYYYDTKDAVRILYGTLWKNSTKSSPYYVPYAYELNYNRNVIHGDDTSYFNDAFKTMLKAALGENEGTAVYDKVMAVEVGSEDKFEQSGTTDVGNYYELTYRYNNANIKVTCSEIVPESDDDEEDENTAEAVEETVSTSTTSVITAGSGAAVNDETEAESTAATEADSEDDEEDEE